MPEADTPVVRFVDTAAQHRYEAYVDGRLAGVVEYRDRGDGRRVLVHTEVDDAFEGRGIASQLARGALDDARDRQRPVVVECEFIRRFLDRHPEYGDIVFNDDVSNDDVEN